MMCGKVENPHRITRRVHDIMHDADVFENLDLHLDIVVDNTTIATQSEILNLWLKYSEFLYTQSDLVHFNDGMHGEIEGGYIFAEWNLYNARNGVNLKRTMDALFSEYNPINNYDMIEESADGKKQDKHKTTPHGTITNTATATHAGIDTVDNGGLVGQTTTTTEYTNADTETTYDNTKSMEFDSTTHAGYHTATEHFLKRSGNIGVTTSAQMITQEIELRVVDLLSDYVKRFFRQYCYYVG